MEDRPGRSRRLLRKEPNTITAGGQGRGSTSYGVDGGRLRVRGGGLGLESDGRDFPGVGTPHKCLYGVSSCGV